MRTIEGIEVDWNEPLWRYVKLDRFLEVVRTSRLYFAAATQFADPFEGAVAVQTNLPPPDPRYAEMEHAERAFFALKRMTKISCWHRADYESDAMWKLYAEASKGIAMCTTPERMRQAFRPFRLRDDYVEEDLWGSPVSYIDLTQVRMRGGNMLERFFWKHRAFAWEREFRLAISLRIAEEHGVEIPAEGIEVEIDLNVLVEHIVLGPEIIEDERQAALVAAERTNLGSRVRFSSLLGRPRYI
jgi:hypothetical protein